MGGGEGQGQRGFLGCKGPGMRAITQVPFALAVPYTRNIDLNLNPSISCNLKELEEPVQWTFTEHTRIHANSNLSYSNLCLHYY